MILERLRHETRDHHQNIEATLDLLRDDFTRSDLRRLLCLFYGFYAPLEPQLLERPEWARQGFDAQRRRKIPFLIRDLELEGLDEIEISSLPQCENLPLATSFAHALGCCYVLEGSTLGGQLLTRHWAAKLASAPPRFFNPYGEATGAMWKEFVAFLEAQGAYQDEDEIVCAAEMTFDSLQQWMQQ